MPDFRTLSILPQQKNCWFIFGCGKEHNLESQDLLITAGIC